MRQYAAANITQQFGAKPLFENVNAKFGEGNRYGLIGANGAGKSTLMKILWGRLSRSAGNVSKEKHERMAYLRQDQFAYEDQRVLDVVLMGHAEMWACMSERDAIYANPEATKTTTCTPPNSSRSSPSTTAIRPKPAPANCCSASAFPSSATTAR
jgi:ATPase subunit of ABC transporter with duplicated ATPase domains